MSQTVRTLLMAVAATSMSFFVAAAAQSDPTPENVLRAEFFKRGLRTHELPVLTLNRYEHEGLPRKKKANIFFQQFFEREVHTLVVPILTVKKSEYRGRNYKKSTIFQFDTKLTDDTDILFRLSAKRKKIFYVQVRF